MNSKAPSALELKVGRQRRPERQGGTGGQGRPCPGTEPGMGRLPGSRSQERRGQGGAPGAPRRREAPAASGQGPTGDSERMVGLGPGLCRWVPRGAPAPPGSCLCRAVAVTPAWGLQMSRKLCLQAGGPRGPSSLRTEGLWGRSLEPGSSPPQSPRHPCSQAPPAGGLGKSPSAPIPHRILALGISFGRGNKHKRRGLSRPLRAEINRVW